MRKKPRAEKGKVCREINLTPKSLADGCSSGKVCSSRHIHTKITLFHCYKKIQFHFHVIRDSSSSMKAKVSKKRSRLCCCVSKKKFGFLYLNEEQRKKKFQQGTLKRICKPLEKGAFCTQGVKILSPQHGTQVHN